MSGLLEHLAGEATTVCRCWIVRRRDGRSHGCTDHDADLEIAGVVCRAATGLTAEALQQSTGLSVDNGEAFGALSDASVSEDDIRAGRFDRAEVTAWLVDWTNPKDRRQQFFGTIGEIRRAGGAFRAELRGLTEALNQPQGRVYQPQCAAVLGDAQCRVDLADARLSVAVPAEGVADGKRLEFTALPGFADRWFEGGRLVVLDGAAAGLVGVVKNDRVTGGARHVELWEALRLALRPGDRVRLEAGCDKRLETCRAKFDNLINFRGFPHIPGSDWLIAHPSRSVAGPRG